MKKHKSRRIRKTQKGLGTCKCDYISYEYSLEKYKQNWCMRLLKINGYWSLEETTVFVTTARYWADKYNIPFKA
jgi:hypothetical protein